MMELSLTGRAPLNRTLHLRLSRGHVLYTTMSSNAKSPHMLAYAHAELARCRLVTDAMGWCLWLGDASFDVSEKEATRIRAALFVRVEKSESLKIFEAQALPPGNA